MKPTLRIPRLPAVAVALVIVILLSAALLAAASRGWAARPGVARAAPQAAPQALTPGQAAALQGAEILLSAPPAPPLYLPIAVR